MHTNIYYDEGTREEKDARAIQDMREYLGNEAKFNLLVDFAGAIDGKERTIQQLNVILAVAGISGRPFHAFCRKYCLAPYIAWLLTDYGDGIVQPDKQGFWGNDKKQEE